MRAQFAVEMESEPWGLFGNACQRAGLPDEARAACETARALDGADVEWFGRLWRLERGLDPFGLWVDERPLMGLGFDALERLRER